MTLIKLKKKTTKNEILARAIGQLATIERTAENKKKKLDGADDQRLRVICQKISVIF